MSGYALSGLHHARLRSKRATPGAATSSAGYALRGYALCGLHEVGLRLGRVAPSLLRPEWATPFAATASSS